MKAGMLAAALLLMGCAGAGHEGRRENLSRQIADDATAFNEAYGQAVSGQILLNILRSRDRLPRHYLAMTGISDSPSWSYSQAAEIGDVPLGARGSPWGLGGIGASRETQRRPSYAVQPFDAETLTRTAFEPTPTNVFAHYWHSGWPRDLLLLLMVEELETVDSGGVSTRFVNEANTIFDDCGESVRTNGCAFVREVRDVLASVANPTSERGVDARQGRPICGLVDAIGPAAPVRSVPPAAGQVCDPVFAIGDTLVRLRLRSLDEMIYYVGELMRAPSMDTEPGEAMDAQVRVGAAGLRGGGAGVPLFRILPSQAAPNGVYAAATIYGGERYFAGPANGRSCGVATASGRCRDNAEEGDRSSSVLSLIAEILALNQSPDAIRAPNRLIAE